MTTHPRPPVRRIVIVHGDPGTELANVLAESGLEEIQKNGDVTVWAPPRDSIGVPLNSPLIRPIDRGRSQ